MKNLDWKTVFGAICAFPSIVLEQIVRSAKMIILTEEYFLTHPDAELDKDEIEEETMEHDNQ